MGISMVYFPNDYEKYPVRKNTRMKNFDYTSPNYYFVTVCTWEKKCIFGKPGEETQFGRIAETGIVKISKHYPDVSVEKYVVMPNHIHMILSLKERKTRLDRIVGSYKSYVTNEIHNYRPEITVWQRSFHDHVIRNEQAFQKIWLYIEGNPGNWEKDCFYVK